MPCVSNISLGLGVEKGGEGFQMRVGTCYIRTLDPFYPIRPFLLARHSNQALRQHNRTGLPCRSHLIYKGVQECGIAGLQKRPSEVIIRPCYRPCRMPKSRYLFCYTKNKAAVFQNHPIVKLLIYRTVICFFCTLKNKNKELCTLS